jgi:uncharacterized protein (TIGR04255 family)
VVAELAIAPHYGLAGKIAAIQDGLRSAYPRTLEATEVLLPVAAPFTPGVSAGQALPAPPQPFWQLLDSTQTRGVLINYRAIALHATIYDDSTDFLSRWSEVLATIERAEAELFVERAGLRYVDLIVPTKDAQPSDYLVSSVHGIEPPAGAQIQTRGWGLSYSVDSIAVQIRTATPAPTNFVLPPTLNTLPLQQPSVMMEAQSRVSGQQPIGWIDTDVSRTIQRPFNAGEIAVLYGGLHQTVSTTFKALLSARAKQEWI